MTTSAHDELVHNQKLFASLIRRMENAAGEWLEGVWTSFSGRTQYVMKHDTPDDVMKKVMDLCAKVNKLEFVGKARVHVEREGK